MCFARSTSKAARAQTKFRLLKTQKYFFSRLTFSRSLIRIGDSSIISLYVPDNILLFLRLWSISRFIKCQNRLSPLTTTNEQPYISEQNLRELAAFWSFHHERNATPFIIGETIVGHQAIDIAAKSGEQVKGGHTVIVVAKSKVEV